MSELRRITPVNGQKNWGNAINSNFELLYRKVNTAIIETQGLKDRVEEIDTLYIKNDNFIYIDAKGKAKICNLLKTKEDPSDPDEIDPNKWENPQGKDFDPTEVTYTTYQGWFVKVDGNSAVLYNGYKWLTGDILIIHKQSASMTANSQSAVIIEQWSSVMGGYFTPAETPDYNTTNGTVERIYNKVPSIVYNGISSVQIKEPAIYFKPTGYLNGSLIFTPYIKIGGEVEKEYGGADDQIIPISYTTKGSGNVFDIRDNTINTTTCKIQNNGTQVVCTCQNAYVDDTTPSSLGFDVNISQVSDILYLSYSFTKENNDLVVTFTKPKDLIGFIIRINVFKA